MKKRVRLRKGPIIILVGVVLLLVTIIVLLIPNDSKEETQEKQTSFIKDFVNISGIAVNDDVKKTIVDLMDIYYLSMKELKEYNMTYLFSNDAKKQAYLTQTAMNYLVNYRLEQRNDLTLKDVNYSLEIIKVDDANDELVITVLEDSNVKFSFMNIYSESFGIKNTFTFKKIKDKYELIAFNKNSDIYNVFTNNYKMDNKTDVEVKNDLLSLNEKNLKIVKDSVLKEKNYYENYLLKKGYTPKKCDHKYNRDLAYSYATIWVNERNDKYAAFDNYGGNCQNYASQVLASGGIPMDITGPYLFKWYGSSVNETSALVGRTPSWTGVSEFYTYALNNRGAGLCASVDVNYFYAEAGDILQVGADRKYAHTIVAVDTVSKDGKIVDILTTSNTTDRKNYPLSAYNYSDKRLIKIEGWNEE